MSLVWVVVGSILQLFLAYFLFMLVVFSAGGVANGETIARWRTAIFDWSMFALPTLCLISATTGYVLYALSFTRQ